MAWIGEDKSLAVASFLAAHVVLARVFQSLPALAAVHAGVVTAIGLAAATRRDSRFPAAVVCAYITGAEVLWRMVSAPLFWEFGKYAVTAIMGMSLLGSRQRDWRSKLMVLYLVCLVPSTLLSYPAGATLGELKDRISFNLSGSVALATAVMFFAGSSLTRPQLTRLFVFVIGPTVGIATLAVFSTFTAGSLTFLNASNYVTSGGFGPNQVSSALGAGVTLCLLYLVIGRAGWVAKTLVFLAMGAFAVQGALTFSRTGLYLAAAAIGAAAAYLVRVPRVRLALALVLIVTAGVGVHDIVPWIDTLTEGRAAARWTNTSMTGRDDIVFEDLALWRQNWAVGVGTGNSSSLRASAGRVAAHTEFSRLLAEHGVLGLACLLILACVAVDNVRQRRDALSRGITLALVVWSLLYMGVLAMRSVAPAFMFGLATTRMALVRSQPPRTRCINSRWRYTTGYR